jgi:hypothetical protein
VGVPANLYLLDKSTVLSIVNVKDFPVAIRWLHLIRKDMSLKPILEGHTQVIDHGMIMLNKYIDIYKKMIIEPDKGALIVDGKAFSSIEIVEENIISYNSQDIFQFMPSRTWCMRNGVIVCMWKTDALWIVESMTHAYIDLLKRVDPLLTATIKGIKLVLSAASNLSVSGMIDQITSETIA